MAQRRCKPTATGEYSIPSYLVILALVVKVLRQYHRAVRLLEHKRVARAVRKVRRVAFLAQHALHGGVRRAEGDVLTDDARFERTFYGESNHNIG